MTTSALPMPGFADPARDAQRAFRAILDALAHPARAYPLRGPAGSPAALGPGLAAVALTLLDEDSVLWLGETLAADAETTAWLAFHTGVRRTDDPAAASFLLSAPPELPPLASLALGTDEAPHLSATAVLDVGDCADVDSSRVGRFTAHGPGIDGTTELVAPWASAEFAAAWRQNAEQFPRGVDLLLVDADTVTGLPRTTCLATADTERD